MMCLIFSYYCAASRVVAFKILPLAKLATYGQQGYPDKPLHKVPSLSGERTARGAFSEGTFAETKTNFITRIPLPFGSGGAIFETPLLYRGYLSDQRKLYRI